MPSTWTWIRSELAPSYSLMVQRGAQAPLDHKSRTIRKVLEFVPPISEAEPRVSLCQGTALAVSRRNLELRVFRLWGSKGGNKLQFRIKDQEYFLAFVEQEKRWYVFAPSPQGVHRIPVYVDAVKWGAPVVLEGETLVS